MPRAKSAGAELAYEITGKGEPLLMILGLTLDRRHWMGFERRFDDSFQVISFDNRGIGDSSEAVGPYSIPMMADDAVAVLDAAGVESAHVLGVSMGGMIAQELALRYPARVKRLVLGCTHFGGPEQVMASASVGSRLVSQGKTPEVALHDMLSTNFAPAFMEHHPAEVARFVGNWASKPTEVSVLWAQLGAIASHDTRERLGEIKMPTLVIAGDRDELVPSANTPLIAARIPGARQEWLPGAAHIFWVEAAEEAHRKIAAFLTAI